MTVSDLQSAFTAALQQGDELAARAVVSRARDAGLDGTEIYFSVFAPGLRAIGDLWERNELSVAEEHLATAITERLIGELSPLFATDPSGRNTVVLGCVEGEQHTIGLRMAADLLRKHGWRVLYLGANVPMSDWVQFASRVSADAVALSVNAQRNATAAKTLIAALRQARPNLLVMVGGAAFDRDSQLWQTIGADVYDPNPAAAIAELSARRAGLPG